MLPDFRAATPLSAPLRSHLGDRQTCLGASRRSFWGYSPSWKRVRGVALAARRIEAPRAKHRCAAIVIMKYEGAPILLA